MTALLISRSNIDDLLNRHAIQMFSHGKWYDIRRNGVTKRWKRDATRIAVPCKVGFRECFTITEGDFYHNPSRDPTVMFAGLYLDPREYRINPESIAAINDYLYAELTT